MEPKVIIICGPTCSGKTKLGILLAELLKSEIISADSRQIYKHLNIGTAKPNFQELKRVKHHFIDYLEPDEEYSASKFEKDALAKIRSLTDVNIVPIVVGGSGLYIKALVDGIFDSVDTDEDFREKIIEEKKKFGNEYIYNKLRDTDPKTASELLPQNWKRVIRALEVYHITGEPIWVHHQEYKRNIEFDFLQFGLRWEREILYRNIEYRVDQMFSEGLVEEVKQILERGYNPIGNSLNTVGYKEIINYLNNEISLERCKALIKRNTRRYAKRQITWFKKDNRIKWFDLKSAEYLDDISQKIIEYVK